MKATARICMAIVTASTLCVRRCPLTVSGVIDFAWLRRCYATGPRTIGIIVYCCEQTTLCWWKFELKSSAIAVASTCFSRTTGRRLLGVLPQWRGNTKILTDCYLVYFNHTSIRPSFFCISANVDGSLMRAHWRTSKIENRFPESFDAVAILVSDLVRAFALTNRDEHVPSSVGRPNFRAVIPLCWARSNHSPTPLPKRVCGRTAAVSVRRAARKCITAAG